MNTNIFGNCIPIVFTILNLQYASELAGKKKALCILSVIYSIVGSITIVLLNSNNKQAAFEWFVLYALGFFVFRFIRNKSADLLSVATNPQAFDSRDYAYHKIVLIKNMMIALLILVFAFSPLFDKLFSDSEIYGLSRYNYISCAFAYIVYCVLYSGFSKTVILNVKPKGAVIMKKAIQMHAGKNLKLTNILS